MLETPSNHVKCKKGDIAQVLAEDLSILVRCTSIQLAKGQQGMNLAGAANDYLRLSCWVEAASS